MRRPTRILVIALLAVLFIALVAGCGANREALRSDGSQVEVLLPPAEALNLRLRGQAPPEAQVPPSAPLSVSDESKGRWLTLFQVNVAPSEAAGVPSEAPASP